MRLIQSVLASQGEALDTRPCAVFSVHTCSGTLTYNIIVAMNALHNILFKVTLIFYHTYCLSYRFV